ncbi:hypothetical protein ACFCYH_09705 [Streptomyces sp. NPDC056400]|uniref:hypothetical protein n=1 Tax=Streptomyces sp. NPDC056400 TaxID=3345808 RepID=UPI0035D92FBB
MQGATPRAIDAYGMRDLLYTVGTERTGALVLHHHPDALRDLARLSGERTDLGDRRRPAWRRRGIARHNAHRPLLRKRPVARPAASFVELIGGHLGDTPLLRDLYEGRLDRVHTLVGNGRPPLPGPPPPTRVSARRDAPRWWRRW